MKAPGFAGIAFFLAHAIWHYFDGDIRNAIWACHCATLLIGIGALVRNADLVGIGSLWLVIGIPLWLYYLLKGGRFYPTSVLTHGGGAIVALLVLRRLRWPRGAWWKAVAALTVLVVLSRLLTPSDLNVNLVFRIAEPSSRGADSPVLLSCLMAAVISVTFFVADRVLRRVFPMESRRVAHGTDDTCDIS